ncbi:MAG: hypothetical protein JNK18_14240 [Cyclobacteriaceae bacterium]|nr:hypothetical protein [Cyclobacteriaceae bacterium]
MKYISLICVALFFSCKGQTTKSLESRPNRQNEIVELIQGSWTHTQDSLATVAVDGTEWTFLYEGESENSSKYQMIISDTLTLFVDKEVKADFLILQRPEDTLYYEINGITANVMSLMHYPSGKLHVYDRLK